MIQEAHIGIGIYGKEGLRAVQASDYAVGEFCCIWKLLLVHGRWSYIRISQMILYFFYKNMIVTIPQFFYGFLCAYSGQTIFDDWYITFYNMLFTVLPLIIRAIFDQDIYYKTYNKEESINKKICAKNRTKPTHFKEFFYLKKYYPSMYYIGQCNTIFTIKNFIYWIVQGWFHGILVFIICIYSHIKNVITESGFTSDLWSFSITMFSCIILMVDLKLALYTHSWTYLMGISLGLGSIVIYFIYVWIADQIIEFNIYKTASLAFSNPRNYLACLICLVSVVIFDVISIILKLEMTDSLVSYFKYLKNTEQGDVKEFYEIAMKRLLRKKKTSKRDNPNFQKEKKFNSSSDCSNQFFNKNKRKFYDEG